jgi:hypothetical protein
MLSEKILSDFLSHLSSNIISNHITETHADVKLSIKEEYIFLSKGKDHKLAKVFSSISTIIKSLLILNQNRLVLIL